jgi:hypothetical protein
MKSPDSIQRFRVKFAAMPGGDRQALIVARALLFQLADEADFAQLADGKRLRDALDFSAWLRELEASVDLALQPVRTAASGVCHACGHAHRDERECGMEMGSAGMCRCAVAVMA